MPEQKVQNQIKGVVSSGSALFSNLSQYFQIQSITFQAEILIIGIHKIQSHFNGSNIFVAMEMFSRQGLFQPLRVPSAPGQEAN